MTASGRSRWAAVARCVPGLEALLAEELEGLGWRPLGDVARGVVEAEVDDRALYAAHLGSGIADRIGIRVAHFGARHFRQLERWADEVDWGAILRAGPFAVDARCRSSKLWHSDAVAERVARVVAEQLGAERNTDPAAARPRLDVRFFQDECSIVLDLCGQPLHRRGWRLETAKAPLREDLAWALVRASGWNGEGVFVDPMCGSGTLAITAAQIACRRAPNLERKFVLDALVDYDASVWSEVAAGFRADERSVVPEIFASDRDAGAIEAVRANAARAGVEVTADVAPLSGAPGFDATDGRPFAVVTNPPYGARVGNIDRLVPLYQTLGHRVGELFEGAPGRFGMLAGDQRLAMRTGLTLQTAFATQNGGIDVRAYTA